MIAYRFHARDAHLVLSPGSESQSPSKCASTEKLPAPPTGSTSTKTATACSATAVSTSSCAKPARCASTPWRSRSSIPEPRLTRSRSGSRPHQPTAFHSWGPHQVRSVRVLPMRQPNGTRTLNARTIDALNSVTLSVPMGGARRSCSEARTPTHLDHRSTVSDVAEVPFGDAQNTRPARRLPGPPTERRTNSSLVSTGRAVPPRGVQV
jgi:hypothetical protein